MASVFTHALVAYTANKLYPATNHPWRILFFAILWSVLPDMDSIGFFLGIPYNDLFGHRGITHSILFAFFISIILVTLFFTHTTTVPTQHRHFRQKMYLVVFFTLIMVLHGILDALTNGGLGVAFFAPFDNTRYFLPWRPLIVSPIGITSFFSEWGKRVIISELVWVGLPCGVILVLNRLSPRSR